MKTIRNIPYWVENGKYTVDGYDFFDTLAELEINLYWSKLWILGKAYKDLNGNWVHC